MIAIDAPVILNIRFYACGNDKYGDSLVLLSLYLMAGLIDFQDDALLETRPY